MPPPQSLPVTFWKLKFSGKCVVSNILLWHTLDINWVSYLSRGLSWWLRDKELAFQCRRCGFNSWVWKIAWEVFLPGKSHGQRGLVGYSPWGCKRVRYNWVNKQQQIYLEGFCQNIEHVTLAIILVYIPGAETKRKSERNITSATVFKNFI